jgi:sulfate transport system permease protein
MEGVLMIFIKNSKRGKKVIPGFSLTMGITMTFLGGIVLIPLASLFMFSSGLTFEEFILIVTEERVLASYKLSFSCALISSLINSFFGVILAWVLVRYRFPFKKILDGLIELPLALPTAVAGISLTYLYSDKGWVGNYLSRWGIRVSYTKWGILIAMMFIGIPFIVRSIQPVLEKLDSEYEEAGTVLGAGKILVFFKIILPEILPAILTGFGLAFARALGEYGSVVFIAGNTPYKTEIAPLLIMGKLEQFDYESATAIALVMLVVSFVLLLLINTVQIYVSSFSKG